MIEQSCGHDINVERLDFESTNLVRSAIEDEIANIEGKLPEIKSKRPGLFDAKTNN